MGTLTDQMQNLTADIVNSHQERAAWLGAFKEEAAEMAKERRARLDAIREEVGTLKETAREMMDGLREEVNVLRDEVAEMLKEFRTDREGAHQAWQQFARSQKTRQSGMSARESEVLPRKPAAARRRTKSKK